MNKTNEIKILHIASWYPNKWDKIEGIFVKKHFEVFSEIFNGHMINVQVRTGKKVLEYHYERYSDSEEGFYLLTSIKSTKMIEILTTLLLLWALYRSKYKQYDLLQFHVAYPLLSYYTWWKHWIKKPVFILEHWTAYHLNFNLPKDTTKLDRIKNIFRQNIPVITVSKALLQDIQEFSSANNFPATVIPNIVDKQYTPQGSENEIPIFFIVNIWTPRKNPFTMLKAFANLAKRGIRFELKIGGYGAILDEMKAFVQNNGMSSHTVFLGEMNQNQIEVELNRSDAYLFASKYETFSVACADALSCGCPLIGPPIPCILEYADENEILTVEEDTTEIWEKQIVNFIEHRSQYIKKKISEKAKQYFSNQNVNKLYQEFIMMNIKR